MILLWGLPGDKPLATVRDALHRLQAPTLFLDQREVLDTEVELRVDSTVEGAVRTPDQTIVLDALTAAYLRPYDARRLSHIRHQGEDSPAWHHVWRTDTTLWSWADISSALIVNRPTAAASNGSKPYQALQIRLLGFKTPATLITTDPEAVREFWVQYGTVIYKSISGTRSIVSRLTPNHAVRLDDVRWCPTQFQQYVPGHDFRVHVVGEEVFACEIVSDADDYRYAARQGLDVEIRSFTLSSDVADRCRALTATLGLSVAGIDLRHTPDGDWYCFEVNPSPAFTYYQQASGHPIGEAVARLLTKGPVTHPATSPRSKKTTVAATAAGAGKEGEERFPPGSR